MYRKNLHYIAIIMRKLTELKKNNRKEKLSSDVYIWQLRHAEQNQINVKYENNPSGIFNNPSKS